MNVVVLMVLLLCGTVQSTVQLTENKSLQGLCLQDDPFCIELAEEETCNTRSSQQADRVNTEICASHEFQPTLSMNSKCSPSLESNLEAALCSSQLQSCDDSALESNFPVLNYTLMHERDGKFNVAIHWHLPSEVNVSGYTLIVSHNSLWSCSSVSTKVECEVIDLPSNQDEFVYSYDYPLKDNERHGLLYIKLIPNGCTDGPHVSLKIPESCHSMCPGACEICEYELESYSPKPPVNFNVVSLCRSPSTSLGVISITWQPGRHYSNPYFNQTYYVALYKGEFERISSYIEVVRKTSVELHNLSLIPDQTYYVKVLPYDCKCGFKRGKVKFSMGSDTPLCSSSFPVDMLSTSVTVTDDHSASNLATSSVSLYQTTNLLFPTPSTKRSSSHQLLTTSPWPNSTVPSTESRTPWLLAVFLVLAILISLLFLLITIILCCLRRSSPPPPFSRNQKHKIPLLLRPHKIDILLIYSLRTPTAEVEYILENFVQPMRFYGVRVLFYDTLHGRMGIPQWMERSVALSSKVFLVCNSQFKKEWENSSASSMEGNLVHILKQNFFAHVRTSSDYMGKYALLFTKAGSKAESCIASNYLQNLQRFLVDSEDPTRLEHVAKFIRNCKAYTMEH